MFAAVDAIGTRAVYESKPSEGDTAVEEDADKEDDEVAASLCSCPDSPCCKDLRSTCRTFSFLVLADFEVDEEGEDDEEQDAEEDEEAEELVIGVHATDGWALLFASSKLTGLCCTRA